MHTPADAQTWQPSGTMLGPLMWDRPVTLPDGTHLIGLRWVNARNNDSLYWYDLRSLLATPTRYDRQTPFVKSVRDIQDYNGNGQPDVQARDFDNQPLFLFDAFTDSVRLDSGKAQLWPSTVSTVRSVVDLDGDAVNDEFHWLDNEPVRCQYGDRIAPFHQWSYVPVQFPGQPKELPADRIVMLGKIAGRVCMLRRHFQLRDYVAYELVELSREDLRSRRDTIRTTLLSRTYASGAYYGSVVLRSDSVWWAFNNSDPEQYGTALRITVDSITVASVDNFWRGSYYPFIGHRGADTDDNWPRVMDADRLIIKLRRDSTYVESLGMVVHRVFDLVRVTDPSTAAIELIGTAFPGITQLNQGSYMNMAIGPDLDSDGLNDLITGWSQFDPSGSPFLPSVNVYLTTQRPVVSVAPTPEQPDSVAYRVVDLGSSWRIVSAAACLASPTTTVELFDLRGARLATTTSEIVGPDLVVRKPRTLQAGAVLARLGSCSIRLQ